jgi:hypothetical protein
MIDLVSSFLILKEKYLNGLNDNIFESKKRFWKTKPPNNPITIAPTE